jgi:hypothetical protein
MEDRNDLCKQRKSALEARGTTTIERAERQLPTFARASQNMAKAAALLDTMPATSTDGVGNVYQRRKSILSTTATLQAESSLQHRAKASILTPPPHLSHGWGTKGRPGESSGGNDFFTSEDFSL